MSRRRKLLPTDLVTANIEKFSHDGRGIAHIDGKTLFIRGGLPGETVLFRYTSQQSRFDEGTVVEVLTAAEERVSPRCPHFGICGGCSLQHLSAIAQISLKQATLLEQFQHIGKVKPEQIMPPLYGSVWGYRRKARMGVKYVEKKQSVLVGFREQRSGFLAELTRCEILHPSVGERIATLRQLIDKLETRDSIAQIEVAVGDAQTALVFRNLVPLSDGDQQALCQFAETTGIYVYLQPAGVDSIISLFPKELPVTSLEYRLPMDELTIQFAPSDFAQINSEINQQMVTQALSWLDPQINEIILELFCGLGNFTLPLARRSAQVVGVEGDANLLKRAEMNAHRQNIQNIHYYVANLADKALKKAWMQQSYSKVLLDPPRSGALEIIQQLPLTNTQRIVYVSCNPATLARDAGELVHNKGFRLVQAGVMDMFPHTAHVESMALFERR